MAVKVHQHVTEMSVMSNTTALSSEDNLCETTFNMQKMYVLQVLKESQTPVSVLCILTFCCL